MVSASRRWLPRTAIERTVCAAAGAAVAGAGGAGSGAACASNGALVPPSTVPTRNNAAARLLKLFDFEITRPRLFVQLACVQHHHAWFSPAPSLLANQALKPIPDTKRAEIVEGREQQ